MNKEILRRPFPPEAIKHREGQGGKMLSYLETHTVIERLNEGCDSWSFEIVEHRIEGSEVIVVGKLIADGCIRMAFGGASISVNKEGEVINIADTHKAAASDALKKASLSLGIGAAQLYSRKSEHKVALGEHGSPPVEPIATDKQLSAITSILRRQRRTRDEVEALLDDRTGKRRLNELTKKEASNLLSELVGANGH